MLYIWPLWATITEEKKTFLCIYRRRKSFRYCVAWWLVRGCVKAISRRFVSYELLPLCNSLRNNVTSMETYSSWVNFPKEICVSTDLMHLCLVRFVTVRLTYIFIDYPDCEYIIMLNTSIAICDFWRFSVLLSSNPSLPKFGNRHLQKACLLTNTRMIHTHMFTINMILM
jgi:hypothetical protein